MPKETEKERLERGRAEKAIKRGTASLEELKKGAPPPPAPVTPAWFKQPVHLNGDCIDGLALSLILEGMEYAAEQVDRRLERIGIIFPSVRTSGKVALGEIQRMVESLQKIPICTPEKKKGK